MKRYYYTIHFSFQDKQLKGEWRIHDGETKRNTVVFSMPYLPEHDDSDVPPLELRAKYEGLLGRGEFINWDEPVAPNVVELIANEDDCAWDQPCAFGHRVDGHAVYCRNERWLYAPTKCRRTWYTGGDRRDEDCRGFKPNPLFQVTPHNSRT